MVGGTTWIHINEKIKVVEGLRYLGGHISTKGNLRNPTQGNRLDKALGQLQRLRYLPASREDKVKIILVKVFPGCLYGIEGGDLSDSQLATLSAAIIDAFNSHNDYHDTELTLLTLTDYSSKDLDPVSQILKRRVVELRRAITKHPDYEVLTTKILQKVCGSLPSRNINRRSPWVVRPTGKMVPHHASRSSLRAEGLPPGSPTSGTSSKGPRAYHQC